jgi:hypothetical protein
MHILYLIAEGGHLLVEGKLNICNATLTVESNGRIRLSNPGAGVNYMKICGGARLILQEGAAVLVEEGASLVLENGASLIFEGGSIILNGLHCASISCAAS